MAFKKYPGMKSLALTGPDLSGRVFQRAPTFDLASAAKMNRAEIINQHNRSSVARKAAAQSRANLGALQRQADANTRMLALALGSGGTVRGGDRRMNVSPYVRPNTPGKGGVLPTEEATFASGAAAGTTVTVTLPSWARARITGTVIEGITAIGTGQLSSSSEQAKLEFSVFVNGMTESEANRVPLDTIAGTLDGPQILPVDIYVGPDVEVTVEISTLLALAADGGGTVFLRFWCGDGTSFSAIAGY